jgi:hypothetical protein
MTYFDVLDLIEAEEWLPAPGFEGLYEVSSFGRLTFKKLGCVAHRVQS